jgi:galactose-1-phosphate uridylyltransferase
MTVTSGKRAKRPKPEKWSFEITVVFVQVPDEKREAFHATLEWLAKEIQKEMQMELTASEAAETVNR